MTRREPAASASDTALHQLGGSWSKHIVGVAMMALCVTIVARKVHVAEVLAALEHFYWPALIWGVACLAGGYCPRILRWAMPLGATGAAATFRKCAAPFLGSIALNNVLPMRLGDMVRALVFPAAMGISRSVTANSLVMERVIDPMTLLSCLAIGLLAAPMAIVPPLITHSAVSLAIIRGVVLVFGLLFSAPIARWLTRRAPTRSTRQTMALSAVTGLLAGPPRSFAVLSHLALWLPTTLAGAVAVGVRPALFRNIPTFRKVEQA